MAMSFFRVYSYLCPSWHKVKAQNSAHFVCLVYILILAQLINVIRRLWYPCFFGCSIRTYPPANTLWTYMNIILSVIFSLLAILLLFKKVVVVVTNGLLNMKSWTPYVVINVFFAALIMAYSASATEWYYYTGRLILFVLGLLALGAALNIMRGGLARYIEIIRLCLRHYWLVAVPSIALLIGLSLFLLVRSYIGPIPEIAGCLPHQNLSFACDIDNPEDIVVTPDHKFIIATEFGAIEPLNRPKPGRLVMLDAKTKVQVPLVVSYGENIWGDIICQRKPGQAMGPHGIDLIKRHDGRLQLAVVSHIPHESVEMFELSPSFDEKSWTLTWRGCAIAPEVNHLNDVSLATDGSFYVTHMAPHDFTIADFLMTTITKADTGYVMRWSKDIGFSEVPGTKGGQPNGVVFDESSGILYVVFSLSDKVSAVDLADGSVLRSFKLDAPDNIVLEQGSLWITSLDHQILDTMRCEGEVSCALPFSITRLNADTFDMEDKWTFRGVPFGLPTVALPLKLDTGETQVLIGSFRSDRLGFFTPEKSNGKR
ncbi:MAG TPA: hypothetical protein EYF94_08125 [Porticoccaceae bacterium]|nr:hypothetical protein [Porticoccaceae bacterium]